MSYAALVRAMSAAGAPPEAIALALDAIEQRDVADEERRAKARDKKRRQRAGDMSGTVPGPSRDEAGTVPIEPAPSPSSSPDPSNNPTPTRRDTLARTRGGAAWPCPAGVGAEHWADFLANRKSKRLGYTATALAGVQRDLAKFSDDEWPPGRIVQHAAERGWGAIFDPRPRDTRNGQRPHHDRAHRSGNGLLDAVLEAERASRA